MHKVKINKSEDKLIHEYQNNESHDTGDLSGKVSELEEKILRILADSENLKKRIMKEKEETSKYCISSFARDVLTIRDNLKLALSNCDAETTPLIEGIKLTISEMDKVLANHGVVMIQALNKAFDPHFHQAMFEVPNDSIAAGIVVEIVQDGFMISERLLRPSLVGVSKRTA